MKTKLLMVFLFAAATVLKAEGDANYTPESRSSSEVFTSKVLNVYSFQEGDGEYIAYVVTWRNHEVVVSPFMISGNDKRYNVGDVVRCQMQQSFHKLSDQAKGRISFTMITPGLVSNGIGDEAQRLEAVRAEIEARRQRRTAGEGAPEPKTP